jgi:predicted ester cyclase
MNDTVARNMETFRRLQEDVIVGGRDDLVEQILAPTFRPLRVGLEDLHRLTAASAQRPDSPDPYSQFRMGLRANQAALSNQQRVINEICAVGDRVWARWRIEATHSGWFLGRRATGRQVSWTEAGMVRFDRDGRIVEGWFQADELNLAHQLGLTLR